VIDSLEIAIVAATPLLLAVQGELFAQRSGLVNLGLEGMMLTSAMTAVVVAQLTGSVAAGFAGGIAGGMLVAAIFGIFAIRMSADQIVTGTAINLLALGATGFIYREMQHNAMFARPVPHLDQDLIVPAAWILFPLALGGLLWNTRFGLGLRACGENPEAARAAGISVSGYRWLGLGIEAILVGLAGAHLSLALSSGFAENMTAGRGFIALSIVIFGRWKLKGAVAGTALFGIAAALQYALQAMNRGVPFHLLLAFPYVVTLLILCGLTGGVRAPEALGKRER
jgi:ABC-type uncharacterized transport system permease subunit